MAIQADGKIVAVGANGGPTATSPSPATTRTGSLDTSFSGDGKQTTDSAASTGPRRRDGVAIQRDGKIVAVGAGRRDYRLRPRPLQPERLARHDLLRRRQADDRFRAAMTLRTGWRSRRTARSSRSAAARALRRLRARPLQPERLARPELLRRRQADDRLRGVDGASDVAIQADGKIVAVVSGSSAAGDDFALARYNPNGSLDPSFSGDGKQTTDFGDRLRRGERGGAPGGRQDRRGRPNGGTTATSRSPATTRTARSTRASPATASRGPISGRTTTQAWGGAPGRRQDRRGGLRRRWRRLRPRPLQPERLARHELLRRRQAADRLRGRDDGAAAVALQGDGKIVAVGRPADDDFALARYLGG